jgi:hypothetical protein
VHALFVVSPVRRISPPSLAPTAAANRT